ncbi:hypothetical protein GCM10009609_10670 [Pseudonocardia aurantiaca]
MRDRDGRGGGHPVAAATPVDQRADGADREPPGCVLSEERHPACHVHDLRRADAVLHGLQDAHLDGGRRDFDGAVGGDDRSGGSVEELGHERSLQ